MHRGFAKMYRKFLEWEWYNDMPCKTLYLHCLLRANHKDNNYKGRIVLKGSFLTGREELSKECGMTVQQVRTSLRKLKSTNHLTSESTSAGTVISVTDFDTYNGDNSATNQQFNQQVNHQLTSDQPATNQQLTTNKNVKNVKNVKNENKYSARDARNAVFDLDWIDDKIWGEWIDFKIKRRAAITKTVVDKNIKDLETLGTDKANAVIIQSMDRGWIGLFELKANNIQCPQPKSQTDIYLEKRYEERLKANEQK